jgi:hypothetical protein
MSISTLASEEFEELIEDEKLAYIKDMTKDSSNSSNSISLDELIDDSDFEDAEI